MAFAIGKFTVLKTLGQGAHSTILHVRRSADSKQYALKVVPIGGPEDHKFLEQAEHEFKVAQKFDHPNLIKVYALEKQKGLLGLGAVQKVHLLIEYVNGKTLDTFKVIPMPQLVQIFAKVAAGLAHMHRRGVCHADLKPNNIMLSRTGEVKVLDYGLAWIRGEVKGRVQGTPEYMAPEQVLKKTVNEHTDVFNFGATMYRLVTFRSVPTVASSMTEGTMTLKGKQYEAQLKPAKECNPQCPRALHDLIHRCLAYDPARRPERVTLIEEELGPIVAALVKSPEDDLEAMEW
jgi:serine/threonine protein kinase